MFEPSKELAMLKGFFEAIPKGAYLTYVEIADKSGVEMDARGKQVLRSALHSLRREYRCDRGVGIELESEKNAMHIVTGRVKRVSSSLKRADKTATRMTERYVAQLPKDDRDRLLATASLFGAIKSMAHGLASIYKPKKLLTVTDQSIPDFRAPE
jgi:hypothetical protein